MILVENLSVFADALDALAGTARELSPKSRRAQREILDRQTAGFPAQQIQNERTLQLGRLSELPELRRTMNLVEAIFATDRPLRLVTGLEDPPITGADPGDYVDATDTSILLIDVSRL